MTNDASPTDVEDETERRLEGDDTTAEADVVQREAGVRLRTNVQAGSASERVNVTAELHARDMAELVERLPSYRTVLSEQVGEAREIAKEANQ